MYSERFETQPAANGWQVTAAKQGAYTLYWSLSPDEFCPDYRVGQFEQTITFADPAPHDRCYFHVLDEEQNHDVTASREIILSGMENLRELGGYLALDGRAVKYGRFYRSARLTGLGPKEVDWLKQLRLRTVLDLRSEKEAQDYPNPVLPGAEQMRISAMYQMDGNEANFDPAKLFTLSEEEMREDEAYFEGVYRTMPFENPAYRWMFDRLLSEKTPILFHCTAGKDRTGVAAALILLALGVPRTVVEQDYMLTNCCCSAGIQKLIQTYYRPGRPDFVKDYLTCIAGVGLHNLAAALDEIEKRYQSYEQYFQDQYDLKPEKLEKLRDTYLQKRKL